MSSWASQAPPGAPSALAPTYQARPNGFAQGTQMGTIGGQVSPWDVNQNNSLGRAGWQTWTNRAAYGSTLTPGGTMAYPQGYGAYGRGEYNDPYGFGAWKRWRASGGRASADPFTAQDPSLPQFF
mmetsp:Transcript_94048/g.130622  ORF Transcript_94048/g.130622 Transcript_94048/m.130622 type:complete len:125 (+) Transcript_94048:54-428(+)